MLSLDKFNHNGYEILQLEDNIFLIKNFPQLIIPNTNYIIQILTSSLRLKINVIRDGEDSVRILKWDTLSFDRDIRVRVNNILINSKSI